MTELEPRLRAISDLAVAEARELGGRHEYDGMIQDLSPDGVRAGLAAAGRGRRSPSDPYDAAHLRVFEEGLRAQFGELELHRSNPLYHLGNLDLACYDRDYAPGAGAGRRQGAPTSRAGPRPCDHAVAALDQAQRPGRERPCSATRSRAWPRGITRRERR